MFDGVKQCGIYPRQAGQHHGIASVAPPFILVDCPRLSWIGHDHSKTRLLQKAESGSLGGPQIPSPVMRMAPKPRRRAANSPPSEKVPLRPADGLSVCSLCLFMFDFQLQFCIELHSTSLKSSFGAAGQNQKFINQAIL
jgi:hypothetical protein